MFPGRSYRTCLPETKQLYDDEDVRQKDSKAKKKMKENADSSKNVKTSNFSINDIVLVKQKKLNKLTPPYNPTPLIIVAIKGSMVTAKSTEGNRWVTRNSSFFKKVDIKKSKPQHNEYLYDSEESNAENDGIEDNEVGPNEIEDNEVRPNEIEDNEIQNEAEVNEGEEEQVLPRRNPPRERNRPEYLREDIENVINLGQ